MALDSRTIQTIVSTIVALIVAGCVRTPNRLPNTENPGEKAAKELASGNAKEAIQDYQAAIALDPKGYADRLGLAQAYLSEGELEQAGPAFKAAAIADSTASVPYLGLCEIDLARKDFPQLQTDARSAVHRNRVDGQAWNYLGLAELKLHQYTDALNALKKAVGVLPARYDILNNFADALNATGDPGDAQDQWQYVADHAIGADMQYAKGRLAGAKSGGQIRK